MAMTETYFEQADALKTPQQYRPEVSEPAATIRRLFGIITFLLFAAGAHAQSLEPRAYSNAPTGLNFLIAGMAYTDGMLAFDPSTAITNAHYYAASGILAYAHTMEAWGNSAKFDMVLPYSEFVGACGFRSTSVVRRRCR